MKLTKFQKLIRKIIYLMLFTIIILCFLNISKRYDYRTIDNTVNFSDYYPSETKTIFKVINGNETIRKVKQGRHVIFIGNSSSKWSQSYAKELNKIFNNLASDGVLPKDASIYYYDLASDKKQDNSKYYDLRRYLKGALVTTDSGEDNLLSPVLYIVNNGEVNYYDISTVAMKNKDNVDDYWTEEQELIFEEEITNALLKYYLNK